jgi:mRNA interferase RelE/StbE
MHAVYTKRFLETYASAPPHVRKAADRRIALLLENLRHPSLRAKKFDEARDVWQARVDGGWRFYFRIQGDTYILEAIGPHPK